MFRRRTMEQLNRKTKAEKTMPIFTTNGYLYKTYLHPISAKSQKRDTTTATDPSESKISSSPNNVDKKIMDFEEVLQEGAQTHRSQDSAEVVVSADGGSGTVN